MARWSLRAWTGLATLLIAAPAIGRAETLPELVTYALEHHPELQAMASSVRAAQEATAPARTWPDPQVSVGIMNVGATEWSVGKMDMAQASVQVAQEIPIRGKLGLMHEAARADVARAEAMLARARNRIAAEVALAGLEIYELDRTVQIEIAIRDRFQDMVRAAEGQFAVGRAMQQDLVSMMLEVEMSDATIREALDRRLAFVAELNGLLNRPTSVPVESLAVAPLPGAPADTATLVAGALRDQPELARLRASVWQAEAMSKLATKERVPDPMVMARYGNRGTMEGIYEVGVSFTLPIWLDRRQNAEVRKASAMLDMQRHETDAMELETRTMVASMAARLAANERLLRSYEETLVPRAEQVVEASLASYAVGQTTLIWVLDNVRKLYRVEKESLMVEVMQRRMFVELEQALGSAPRIAEGASTYVR